MVESSQHNKTFLILFIGTLLFLMVAGSVWILKASPWQALPESIAGVYIPEGRPVVGIQMTDQDGQPFTEQNFKGKWSFLFFGFTNCPDVCPTTLMVMKTVWAKLPEAAKQAPEPQLVFVSVDPDRDTPQLLKQYLDYYNPEFIGITGAHKYLDILTVQVGALYGYEDVEGSAKDYTVNHSAQLVLIDPNGYFRGVFSTPHQVNEIIKSFTAIREYHANK